MSKFYYLTLLVKSFEDSFEAKGKNGKLPIIIKGPEGSSGYAVVFDNYEAALDWVDGREELITLVKGGGISEASVS